MDIDGLFSSLRDVIDSVQGAAAEVMNAVLPPEDSKEHVPAPESQTTEKVNGFSPSSSYVPKLGDIVRVLDDGRPASGRVTIILKNPRRISVQLGFHRSVTRYWDQVEPVSIIGYIPTENYFPEMGDHVRVLDNEGKIVLGYVTAIHAAYRSVKVAVGELSRVTAQVTTNWNSVELIGRNSTTERVVQESLDDALGVPDQDSSQGDDGLSAKAYEDLTMYYEGELQKAREAAQQVSQQFEDFKKAIADRLDLKPSDNTQRDIMSRIKQIRIYVLDDVKRATKKLQSAVDLWENP